MTSRDKGVNKKAVSNRPSQFVVESSIWLEMKPWDDKTDMFKLEEAVRAVEMEGLLWGASILVCRGYGLNKMMIKVTIVNDLVSVDNLIKDHLTAEPINKICGPVGMKHGGNFV